MFISRNVVFNYSVLIILFLYYRETIPGDHTIFQGGISRSFLFHCFIIILSIQSYLINLSSIPFFESSTTVFVKLIFISILFLYKIVYTFLNFMRYF